MTLGIFPNISKKDILKIVEEIACELKKAGFDFFISDSLLKFKNNFFGNLKDCSFLPNKEMIEKSDMVISIGGDGTMLCTAFEVRKTSVPILGVNYGKLGFLAEFDVEGLKKFWNEIKNNEYVIEERMALLGISNGSDEKLYAINDIVVDKGPWHKMIELTIKIDDDYVSTFPADGIIIATPTGSTGYSLSTGGPIVNPQANVITLSPIAPHSLTMRPLVVSSDQKITVMVNSLHGKVQVSCDGQRAYSFDCPASVTIQKSKHPVRLVHSNSNDYYEILRNKLYWGLDVRKTNKNTSE